MELAPNNPYGLSLQSPLIAAAGCLGYGIEYARHLGLHGPVATHGLGALVTGTTTYNQRRARPLPQLVETPAGLLYRGSEHNPGLRAVLKRCANAWAKWELPIIVSVAGANPNECAEVAGELEAVEGVRGVEVPLTLHNALQLADVTALVQAVRAATLLPLLVKLPLYGGDVVGLAKAAVAAGADTLVLGDGLPGIARDPVSGELVAGLVCGPATRPQAFATIAAVCATADVPVVAVGGVATSADAQAYLAMGAAAVGLGSVLITDPRAAQRIAGELTALTAPAS